MQARYFMCKLFLLTFVLLYTTFIDGALADADGSNGTDTTINPDFTMMLSSPMAGSSFERAVVYENGVLKSKFEECVPRAAQPDNDNDKPCFIEEIYTDRISFEFMYGKNASYTIKNPTVTATGGTSHPLVTGFSNENRTGSFTIMYRCDPGNNVQSWIKLSLPYTEMRSVEMEWGKRCGSGAYPHMKFGYLADEELVPFPKGEGEDLKGVMELDPVVQTLHVVAALNPPAEMQEFLAPSVSTTSKFVDVSLRGITTAGTMLSDQPTQISVLHTCKQNEVDSALVSFTMAMPPWDNVTAHWRKNCGGNNAPGLQIGTGGPGTSDVLQSSKLSGAYNVNESSTLSDAVSKHIQEIDADTSAVTYYIANQGQHSTIHVDPITITASHPDVVTTKIEVPRLGSILGGGYLDGQHRATLTSAQSKSLRLHFYCRKKGESLILVTLPIFIFKTVEFGFVKICRNPVAYRHSGFLVTAGSLLHAIITVSVLASCLLGWWCIKRKRQSHHKYQQLPQDNGVSIKI